MNIIGAGQNIVFLALGLGALGLQVWALVTAIRFSGPSYPAAGKQSKPLWVTITAVSTAVGFVSVNSPLGFLNIIAVAACAYFLVGVKPALQSVQGPGGRTSSGPYGGW